MKKVLLIVASFIFFAGYASCEELKMNGWGKVEWGMTEDAVKLSEPKVEAGDNTSDGDIYYFPLILKNVKIADMDFTAKFRFKTTSKKLDGVVLTENDKGELFGKLLNLLKQKYGLPTKDNLFLRTRTVIWTIDKTNISLNHFQYANIVSLMFGRIHQED